MPSLVKIDKTFFGISPLGKKSIFPFENFFCKEKPKKVLEILARDYFIGQFKSIYLPKRTIAKFENYNYIFSLYIFEAENPAGTRIVKSVKDFDLSFVKQDNSPKYFESNQQELLSNLITRMLVYVHANSYRVQDMPKVEKITNYLVNRKEKKDEEYESRIKDILELSSVFLRKRITLSDLEKTELNLPKIGEKYLRLPGLNC